MIEQDRVLLARLARVNTLLGAATLELFEHQDGGELPAEQLRQLGLHLSKLSVDLLARAKELGDPAGHVIIDTQP